MCGRYSITSPTEAIQKLFQVPERPNLPPRYNVAPTQEVPAVRLGEDGARHLALLRWGLIPFWAKDAMIGNRLINARAESAATKPAFRAAFKARRCLVVADGFYEWKKPEKKGAAKQPYRATLKGGGPFGFAGLWERWNDPETQSTVESCTILTTDANPLLADIHERMPVIVDPADFDTWLDASVAVERAEALLKPFPAAKMAVYPVSTRVNSVANDGPDVVEPLDGGVGPGQAELF
jgi:putative SOS response-associated peptidase YedK